MASGVEVVTIWQGVVDDTPLDPLPLFETLVVTDDCEPQLVCASSTEADAMVGHQRVAREHGAQRR